jgi:hypothetical protein
MHSLEAGQSREQGLELIKRLNEQDSIHLSPNSNETLANLSTDPLWGEARGKMFGVLTCLTAENTPVTVYAFSGQYNGQWEVEGWAPPLFDVGAFHILTDHQEKEIKKIGREIDASRPHSKQWLALRKKRRTLSQTLMKEIHNLYSLTNFRGDTSCLEDVFLKNKKIPTGTGDCCAPKLLNYAAKNNLRPTGISEFFYGRQTKSGSHQHGRFSSSCQEKCAPILGFMLCGLEAQK